MNKLRYANLLVRIQKNMDQYKAEVAANDEQNKIELKTQEAHRIKTSFYEANISQDMATLKFSDIEVKNEKQKMLINILTRWDIKKDFRLPYVFGPPGTGKSYIAKRFAAHLIVNGFVNVKFVSLASFLIDYRSFEKNANTRHLTNPTILILDDFCAHNITQQAIELIFTVINERLECKKPTLITSNVPMNKIKKYITETGRKHNVRESFADAIEDRIFDLCSIYILKGKSIRAQNALERLNK